MADEEVRVDSYLPRFLGKAGMVSREWRPARPVILSSISALGLKCWRLEFTSLA